MSKFVLPYEPQYTAHREAEKRHQDVADWLRRLEGEESAPPIVPDHSDHAERPKARKH